MREPRLHVWRLEHVGCVKTPADHWHGPASGFGSCRETFWGFGWVGPTPDAEGYAIDPTEIVGVLDRQLNRWWDLYTDPKKVLPAGWQFSLYSVPVSAAVVTPWQVVFQPSKARLLKQSRRTGRSFIGKEKK